MIGRLKRLWQLSGTLEGPPAECTGRCAELPTVDLFPDATPSLEDEEYFMVFECPDCGQDVSVNKPVNAGQIGLVLCPECGETWAVKAPRIIILRASDPRVSEVWSYASEDGH